jgi:two-component system, NtrC family, response regulator PilR
LLINLGFFGVWLEKRMREPPLQYDVLVLDDEEDIRELIGFSLRKMGLSFLGVASLKEALQALETGVFRLCLTDMRLPDGDGLVLVEHIQDHYPGLPVAVMTAYGSMETAIRALKGGAFDFVTKPVDLKTLRVLIEQALKRPERLDPLRSPEKRLLGDSEVMMHLRARIRKLAHSQAPVFIHGESGTGKEVIARLIHDCGPRAHHAFVPVNCGAIPPELVESELFGHRKGAFTGAIADKPGLFQTAEKGSLFLDEVGDLPLAVQVKLLRAIQEHHVRPVGASEEIPVDVRILSASHRNLAAYVEQGLFRQDLYFRINVIELDVPPLRLRLTDLAQLVPPLLKRLSEKSGQGCFSLSPDAWNILASHDFPGNVRELENILERACALAEGPLIHPDDLGELVARKPSIPLPTQPENDPKARDQATPAGSAILVSDTGEGEEAKERAHVLGVLEETRWNRSAAARALGMSLRQLRYRLQKWKLD